MKIKLGQVVLVNNNGRAQYGVCVGIETRLEDTEERKDYAVELVSGPNLAVEKFEEQDVCDLSYAADTIDFIERCCGYQEAKDRKIQLMTKQSSPADIAPAPAAKNPLDENVSF